MDSERNYASNRTLTLLALEKLGQNKGEHRNSRG